MSGALGSEVWAEEKRAEQAAPESLNRALNQQVEKRVKLTLTSEQDLEGTVASVTAQSVQVKQLAGAESFDAVVRRGHVSAVIVRGRAK